jgi:hypothetical protein
MVDSTISLMPKDSKEISADDSNEILYFSVNQDLK